MADGRWFWVGSQDPGAGGSWALSGPFTRTEADEFAEDAGGRGELKLLMEVPWYDA